MLENKIKKSIKVSSLAILLLICLCQIGLAAESSVSVLPQTIDASQGDVFAIDIVVDPTGASVYGAQYELHFDKNILKATSQNKGTLLSRDDTDTIEVMNNINNTIGRIDYGETRIGDPEAVGGVSEEGVLASITFEAIGTGTSDLQLDATLSDSRAERIEVTVNSGTCTIVGAGQIPVSEKNGLPGFGIVCSVTGLIVVSLLMAKKRFR
jgi:hypothetical protein